MEADFLPRHAEDGRGCRDSLVRLAQNGGRRLRVDGALSANCNMLTSFVSSQETQKSPRRCELGSVVEAEGGSMIGGRHW